MNLDGKAYEKMTRDLPLCQILDCLSFLRESAPAKAWGENQLTLLICHCTKKKYSIPHQKKPLALQTCAVSNSNDGFHMAGPKDHNENCCCAVIRRVRVRHIRT
jgi:hypothetical protein